MLYYTIIYYTIRLHIITYSYSVYQLYHISDPSFYRHLVALRDVRRSAASWRPLGRGTAPDATIQGIQAAAVATNGSVLGLFLGYTVSPYIMYTYGVYIYILYTIQYNIICVCDVCDKQH